jgi:hypothetical protein
VVPKTHGHQNQIRQKLAHIVDQKFFGALWLAAFHLHRFRQLANTLDGRLKTSVGLAQAKIQKRHLTGQQVQVHSGHHRHNAGNGDETVGGTAFDEGQSFTRMLALDDATGVESQAVDTVHQGGKHRFEIGKGGACLDVERKLLFEVTTVVDTTDEEADGFADLATLVGNGEGAVVS